MLFTMQKIVPDISIQYGSWSIFERLHEESKVEIALVSLDPKSTGLELPPIIPLQKDIWSVKDILSLPK